MIQCYMWLSQLLHAEIVSPRKNSIPSGKKKTVAANETVIFQMPVDRPQVVEQHACKNSSARTMVVDNTIRWW